MERNHTAGFTLVELLIGMSLSLIIMAGVLSSYVFLGRNFTRSLGISSSNQPTLESQGRRTLAYFTQDVRMASGLDTSGVSPKVTPSNSGMTLVLPPVPPASVPKYVTYYFNGTNTPVTLSSFTIPAMSLVRIDLSTSTAQTLHTNLLNFPTTAPNDGFYLRYYDASGQPYDNSTSPYTTFTDYLSGIKQLSMTFTAQAGKSVNGTLTQVYQVASSRLILRNKQLLP